MSADPGPPDDCSPVPSPAPRLSRSARREKAAADVLRTMIRDLVERIYNVDDLPAEPVDLSIDLSVDPGNGFALAFSPSLGDQVIGQMDEITARHGAYVPGHVYCFRCRSAACEHSAPPSATMVFASYSATGVPQWIELVQALIDVRDNRVHRLYGEKPGTVARVVSGKELKSEQLGSFGKASKTYVVLGQVVAGYFPMPRNGDGRKAEQDRLAITYQFVETRQARGKPALHVNAVCTPPGPEPLSDLFAGGWGAWILRAQRNAERAVRRMESQLTSGLENGKRSFGHGKILGRIPQVMAQLATSLESGFRQSQRRTHHAEWRRTHRPVERALADTRSAASEDFLMDEKTGNTVVQGEHGRFHVFTTEGKHVTSFKSGPNTIEFRVRTHRWRYLAADERERWRTQWEESVSAVEEGADDTEPAG